MLKKRGTACGVLAVVLLLGTLFGTWRSLTGLQRDTREYFYTGVDESGYGIATNLDLRVEYARNLCKIASKYDAGAETGAVESACAALEDAEGFAAKYDANNDLAGAVDALSLKLQDQALSQEDEDYRKSLTADIASYEMKIDKLATPFNQEVRSFNQDALGSFPGGILGRLTGVKELEEFA